MGDSTSPAEPRLRFSRRRGGDGITKISRSPREVLEWSPGITVHTVGAAHGENHTLGRGYILR